MRKLISLLVKTVVSGLLLYFALRWVNIETFADRLRQIKLDWMALAVIILVLQMVLLALRWRRIMHRCGADLPFLRLFRFGMIGAFFNQTLPSSVGGDAVRIWLVGKQTNWLVASYSVLLDRVIGLGALAALVVVCLPWTFAIVHNPIGRIALLAVGLGSLGGWLVFLALGWKRWHILQRWPLTRHLAASAAVAIGIFRSPSVLVPILSISVLIHLLNALSAWCVARSVGADLSLINSVFVVLPVALIAVIPISIAGWGVREGAMVAAFAYAGLPRSDGLLVSLLFGICYLLLGALGGLIWILSTQRAERNVVADGINKP